MIVQMRLEANSQILMFGWIGDEAVVLVRRASLPL